MKFAVLLSLFGSLAIAQEVRQVLKPDGETAPVRKRLPDGSYLISGGSRIPLTVLNSVSSKNSQPGDQIYLQTLVPIAIENRIVIPAGSYVTGTITDSKRPGKVKGRGEIGMRFDSMLLASGTTLNLTGRISSLDGDNEGTLKRDEGTVKSGGSVGKDAAIIGTAAAAGTGMGRWIGDKGSTAGIGAGAGGAAGLAAVLLTRGPDAVLQKGQTVDMMLTTDMIIPASQ